MKRLIFYAYLLLIISRFVAANVIPIDFRQHYNTQSAIIVLPNTFHRALHEQSSLKYRQSSQHTNLAKYSCAQLKTYFAYHGYSEKDILEQNMLYLSDEFVKLAKTCSGYEKALSLLYERTQEMSAWGKLWHWMNGDYCSGFADRVAFLHSELIKHKKNVPQQQYASKQPIQNNIVPQCQQQLISALETHKYQTEIANSLDQIAQHIFNQADSAYYYVDTQIENAIDISLHILRNTSNTDEFVFHTAFIDHVLSDIEEHVTPEKPTLLQRSPHLLAQALTTFVKALNPVKQVKNTCEFIVHTAHFVADITLGKIYLSEQQYNDRINGFWSSCEALSPSNLAQLEAEQWVDLIAQCAADCVFLGGIGKAVRYLKEIEAVTKVRQHATRIAQKLKHAIDASLAEQPLFVTAEGLVLRATNDMKQLGGASKEVITNSKALLESACNGLLADLEKEMAHLRILFDGKIKGLAEFSIKYLKPDYEHILGFNPIMGRFGISKIGGFHHDFMHSFRRSGIFDFVDLVKTETGFYKADIFAAGRYIDTKTFFPANWSRKEVIEKIYEAYENFVKSSMKPVLEADGKYKIDALLNEKVKIRMFITKNGVIKTAYPILE